MAVQILDVKIIRICRNCYGKIMYLLRECYVFPQGVRRPFNNF